MAPLTTSEMDRIHKLKAEPLTPMQIHEQLVKDRRRRKPDLTTVRRFVKGKTHKRATTETRGRKKKLSVANAKAMDRARDKLITQGDREREISWDEVVLKVRVPSVHRATAAKHMLRELGVKVLHPRAKLTRSKIDEAERKRIRNRLRKLPSNDWTSTIRLTMDNKRWPLPLSLLGKKSLRQTKVRFILRNKHGGLKKGYAKPDKREHRTNLGCVNVVAGITKWTDRIWHYFDGKWDAEKAAQVYRTAVSPALRRAQGGGNASTQLSKTTTPLATSRPGVSLPNVS